MPRPCHLLPQRALLGFRLFEAAQRELKEAEKVVVDDFFLNEFRDEFMDNARYLISEASRYCRIHQRIDIGDLSDRLNLSRDEGEKWIVNLIRETQMGADAKIDLEQALGAAMSESQQRPQQRPVSAAGGGAQQGEQPVVVDGVR